MTTNLAHRDPYTFAGIAMSKADSTPALSTGKPQKPDKPQPDCSFFAHGTVWRRRSAVSSTTSTSGMMLT
jgi:hypothetical protein